MTADLSIAGLLPFGPDGAWRRGEVSVTGGLISSVGAENAAVAREHIDMGECLLLPGMIDAHVHCLSHPGEGVAAATRSAAAGGVTTIVEMPFDQAGAINSPERLERKRELVEREAVIDVALLATIAPDGGWRETAELAKGGACGFKVSLFDTDSVRFPRIDDAALLDVFAAIADSNLTVCVHAENNEIIKSLLAELQVAGGTEPIDHADSRPPVSETQGVLTALDAAWYTNVALHLCHLSLPRSVELARSYAARGANVTLETCPHYLVFTADDMKTQGGRLKINPPVRSENDRLGLWRMIGDGDVDVISSDHAPWPLDQKTNANIFDNHSGVPGVETILPLVLGAALDQGEHMLDPVLEAVTYAPAKRFGLADRKGRLQPGYDADIVAYDPSATSQIDEGLLHSNAGWSPYHGLSNTGRVALTVSRGRVVWDGTRVVGEPGDGKFVAPEDV